MMAINPEDRFISKHFQLKEFYQDQVIPKNCFLLPDIVLVNLLDDMRDELGEPIIITSGIRTVTHNKAVGGVENSAHLYGRAADIKSLWQRGINAATLIDTAEIVLKRYNYPIGLYKYAINNYAIHLGVW